MPKAFSERERALIQEQLLEQGERLFSTYGLKKTNLEEIAHAVGISKGAFYLFYESKEALFMDVIECAERRYRELIFASVDQPGPSPRLRLYAILEKAFTLLGTMPLLQIFNSAEYETLLRRMPADKVTEHLASDHHFISELVARCQASGIPICAPLEQIHGLLYALLFAHLHAQDLPPAATSHAPEILVELVAAFCLGEVTLQAPLFTMDV